MPNSGTIGAREVAEGLADEALSDAGGQRYFYSSDALRKWSLRAFGLGLLPAVPAVLLGGGIGAVLGLFWLGAIGLYVNRLAKHADCRAAVLRIDAIGITDLRVFSRCLYWGEIARIEPFDPATARCIEIHLNSPGPHLGGSFGTRLGAWLQPKFGVPAVAINLVLVDATAAEVARSIAIYRSELLPRGLVPAA